MKKTVNFIQVIIRDALRDANDISSAGLIIRLVANLIEYEFLSPTEQKALQEVLLPRMGSLGRFVDQVEMEIQFSKCLNQQCELARFIQNAKGNFAIIEEFLYKMQTEEFELIMWKNLSKANKLTLPSFPPNEEEVQIDFKEGSRSQKVVEIPLGEAATNNHKQKEN